MIVLNPWVDTYIQKKPEAADRNKQFELGIELGWREENSAPVVFVAGEALGHLLGSKNMTVTFWFKAQNDFPKGN